MPVWDDRNEKENGIWKWAWKDWWLDCYEVGVLLGYVILKEAWVENVPDLASWWARAFNYYSFKHCLCHGWLIINLD